MVTHWFADIIKRTVSKNSNMTQLKIFQIAKPLFNRNLRVDKSYLHSTSVSGYG